MSFGLRSKSLPSSYKHSPENAFETSPVTTTPKEELLVQLPGCTVNLVQEGEAVEIAKGDFILVKLSAEKVPLAVLIKVGEELQWPLTKDEPVVKVDELDYLFSLRMEDMNLVYGVSFSQQSGGDLTALDSFLEEHSCFSEDSSSNPPKTSSDGRPLDWVKIAPRIEHYSAVLAKAIPSQNSKIAKGVSKLADPYTKQVQKLGAMVITEATEEMKDNFITGNNKKTTDGTLKSVLISKGLERVKAISERTEQRSKIVLNIVEMGTGSAAGPVSSNAGKQILATKPGEVLLDSFGALSRVMDAAEVAEKQALAASSKTATKIVSDRFGESAGEATEDVFVIAEHAATTASNIVKTRQAIDPASSVSSTMAKNAIKKNV